MGSFAHGGGPIRAARSAEGQSPKRSASWAGQIAGKAKRSAEKVSASRNWTGNS